MRLYTIDACSTKVSTINNQAKAPPGLAYIPILAYSELIELLWLFKMVL